MSDTGVLEIPYKIFSIFLSMQAFYHVFMHVFDVKEILLVSLIVTLFIFFSYISVYNAGSEIRCTLMR